MPEEFHERRELLYKCRCCGKRYVLHSYPPTAKLWISNKSKLSNNAVYSVASIGEAGPAIVSSSVLHACPEGAQGIADLVGLSNVRVVPKEVDYA